MATVSVLLVIMFMRNMFLVLFLIFECLVLVFVVLFKLINLPLACTNLIFFFYLFIFDELFFERVIINVASRI